MYKFTPMNKEAAIQILSWNYSSPYDFYNLAFDKEDYEEWLEMIEKDSFFNEYAVYNEKDELVGSFSYHLKGNTIDIGFGLIPSLTGKGFGKQFIVEGISFGLQNLFKEAKKVSLSVASFNQRAINVYLSICFNEGNHYMQKINNDLYEFIKMELSVDSFNKTS